MASGRDQPVPPLQDVLIFQSQSYGRVFALDGVLQVTERDEVGAALFVAGACTASCRLSYSHAGGRLMAYGLVFASSAQSAYQETIAHTPMFVHPDPKVVLIIGGGDGGVVREVTRHKGVERVRPCTLPVVGV